MANKIEEILQKYKVHQKDSGSVPVQIIKLTEEINRLVKHLKAHQHDFDSKLGLLKMVSKRRRYLNYLKRKEKETYQSLINDLGLRK